MIDAGTLFMCIGLALLLLSLGSIAVALDALLPAYTPPIDIDQERARARSRNWY